MVAANDIQWLRELHAELWPMGGPTDFNLGVSRRLTQAELDRVIQIVEIESLLTQMTSGMFGAYGMKIYEHPLFPGLAPSQALLIAQEHLPTMSRYDLLRGIQPPEKSVPGCGRGDAWELFSRFTHSERNREWLKKYHMTAPRERSYYDY